ncbi:MAG TPA: cyclase family protein [Rubrobacter sp.]|nr:cyclase family protein [Rubrobacter sp.]
MKDGLLDALESGIEVYDLAQPLAAETPHSPNHPPFRMALVRRHGDIVRKDGSSAANELISTSGHTGTHVDALVHVSYRGHLHGGTPAHEAQQGGRFSVLGVDTIEPLVCRGVLLDVAGLRGVEVLPGGYGITEEDLASAEREAGVQVRAGDVALIRSGWAQHFGDAGVFLGHESGVPGPTEEAARWLAGRGVRATGAETIAYEQIKPEVGHALLPVHRLLLVEHGIPIIEVMNLSGLAAAGVQEFVFVLAPLKIVGGTGSPVRPLALVQR